METSNNSRQAHFPLGTATTPGTLTGDTVILGMNPPQYDTLNKILAETLLGTKSIQAVAGQTLSGQRLVGFDAAGEVVYADFLAQPEIIGITENSANAGAIVRIRLAPQAITDPSFSFVPQTALFLGANGQILQSKPASGFAVRIGIAVTSNSLFFNPFTPVQQA
jgi:hypothetical protein